MACCYAAAMGMQDRDYYREWWKQKTGDVEPTVPLLPESSESKFESLYSWHPVLPVLLFAVICLVTYFVLWFIKR